ncbi:MAG TPA: DUF2764 family protein [Lentimicrobium sp.]|nr:DUF2764 family protein [Lentimicrobium sp.]
MGTRNYYYLIAGLPDLSIDQGKLQFGSVEFREYLKSELSEKDYKLVEWLFLPIDNQNLLVLLKKSDKEWNTSGIYSPEDLEYTILEEKSPDKIIFEKDIDVKPYIKQFIRSAVNEERGSEISYENEVTALYYLDALKVNNKFLRNWFEFEINIRNLLIFNIAQQYNLSFENQLLGNTSLVNSLRQKTGRDVGDAAEWNYYDRIIQISETTDIALREKSIDLLKWSVLDEMNTFNYFSIEIIISYMIKLMIIERWLKLDPKTGEELFRRLIGDLQSGYDFPNEFSVNDGKR